MKAVHSTELSATARDWSRKTGTRLCRSRRNTRNEMVFPTKPMRHRTPMKTVFRKNWKPTHASHKLTIEHSGTAGGSKETVGNDWPEEHTNETEKFPLECV